VETEVALAASLNASGVVSAHTDTTVNPLSATKSVMPKTARTISKLVGPMIDDTGDDLKEMREMVTSFNSDLAQEVASLGHISMPDFPELDLSCTDDIFQTEGVRPLPSLLSPIHMPSKGDSHQKKHPSSVDLSGHGSSRRTDVAKPVDMKKPKPKGESPSKKKRTSEKSSHESSHHANPKGASAMPRNKELKRVDFRGSFNQELRQPKRLPYLPSSEEGHWTTSPGVSLVTVRCRESTVPLASGVVRVGGLRETGRTMLSFDVDRYDNKV